MAHQRMTRALAMTLHAVKHEAGTPVLPISIIGQIPEAGDGGSGKDPLLERLVRSLLSPEEAGEVLRGYYTDAFHAKLMQRLHVIRNETTTDAGRRKAQALPEWRLKRVTAFVHHNLDQPLTLACLARVAGLSRMHFAALFRRATGLRPHDYVMQRRIDRAQQMLAGSPAPIVDIALSVGFQSQAHFTTVFKRLVGLTPHQWRLMRGPEALAA